VLPFEPSELPDGAEISMAMDACQSPNNRMRLHNSDFQEKPKHDFVVCLSGPLKRNYDNQEHFVQWVEIQRMFGAERFAVYNHSGSAKLRNYFQMYTDDNILDYISWNVPPAIQDISNYNVLWNFGQQAMVNDCLYRYMYATQYLMFTDLDELIVPRCDGCNTWADMMTRIQTKCPEKLIQYSIMNAFFPTQVKDNKQYTRNLLPTKLKITSLLKTYRAKEFGTHNERSKFIIKPTFIRSNNIHSVMTVWGGKPREHILCVVSPDDAALHHYRHLWRVVKDVVPDDAMIKFEGNITDRLQTLYGKHHTIYGNSKK
jgi:hypothetical protein